ncbi:uncharacterized protein N7515_006278 [Penicillium bovifimosum]|uniref:N-terminal of MaoC-like dehydratase domain-containing protein n=1 Tax=Penicillium bovifimosum TaxID=126998 RepID=A0A9W9GVY4_9EURO|nr:uncharacterized protein N7515_006278 [Penicillium bovifimosum]KAJ5130239.1 hypothetical protein N7515_006278 [Penicillium bovifimosum]
MPSTLSLLAHMRPCMRPQGVRPSAIRSFSISQRLRSPDASSVASSFLSRFQTLGPQTRTQTIDANQLQLLSLTINRPTLFPGAPSLSNGASAPQTGVPVPPGYHLAYFTPAFMESELGADGTDASYNPDAPFTRRMWAGGEVLWPRVDGEPNPLRVGQQVQETTRVLSAEAKVVKKTGEDMIVVGVEKEFANEYGVSIIDRRNWVFRKALPVPSASTPSGTPSSSTSHIATQNATSSLISTEGNTHTRTLVQTPVTLFRFSALTFNAHKIHYSLPWARDVEGHKDIVVHGPLNLISILDLWRDTRQNVADPTLVVPERISYRATSPLYAGEEYRIVLEEGEGTKVQIIGPGGMVHMKAEIH